MGLSSSKQKTTQQATTTPTNPPWVEEAVKAQTGNYNEFMALDPQSLVAGPSALQQKAFAGVDNLGGWRPGLDAASRSAQAAGQAGPNLFGGVQLGQADQVGQTAIAPLERASASQAIQFYDQYKNPALRDVVDATLAEYDANSGRQRAAMQAQAAGAGAFGGSRYGVAQGTFEGETGRGRASTDANLRSNAFLQAMGLAGADADRAQNVNLFNTGSANNRNDLIGQMEQQRQMTNTGFNNQFKLAQGGFDQQTGMFNAGQRDNALSRQLQAAGLSADIANSIAQNDRADLGLTADLGNIQQQIAQAQAYAPAQQLLIGSQALGATPYNLFTGQNMSGTTTQKNSPSLFGSLVGGASLFL